MFCLQAISQGKMMQTFSVVTAFILSYNSHETHSLGMSQAGLTSAETLVVADHPCACHPPWSELFLHTGSPVDHQGVYLELLAGPLE